MKIILIHPPTEFLKQAYGVQSKAKFGHAPPLGIGYIASYLELDGHTVKLLDASAMQITMVQTIEAVKEFNPDLIGLSVLTNYADSAKLLAEKLKEALPTTTIVLGGPHATYFRDSILDDMPHVDHVIYGEADNTIRDYANNFGSLEKLPQIKGLVYRDKDGKVVVNEDAGMVHDMDTIPMPAWHLYDMSLYSPLPFQYRNKPFFTMITSRGCWYKKCTFCFQAGSKSVDFRRHSPERVVEEMEILYKKFRIREVAFWDDTFIMNLRWQKRLAEGLKAKNVKITWAASGRVNIFTEELARTIKDAGCWSIFLGIESGNQNLLDQIKKGITLDEARKALKIINKVGLETRAAFMLGLPGETPEMSRKTIEFAIEIDPTYAIFYATHPRNGTELYQDALIRGQFLTKSFKGMSRVTYVPEGYKSSEELENMVRHAYFRFYLRPRLIIKMLGKIKTFAHFTEIAKGFLLFLGLSNLFVAMRSLFSVKKTNDTLQNKA